MRKFIQCKLLQSTCVGHKTELLANLCITKKVPYPSLQLHIVNSIMFPQHNALTVNDAKTTYLNCL